MELVGAVKERLGLSVQWNANQQNLLESIVRDRCEDGIPKVLFLDMTIENNPKNLKPNDLEDVIALLSGQKVVIAAITNLYVIPNNSGTPTNANSINTFFDVINGHFENTGAQLPLFSYFATGFDKMELLEGVLGGLEREGIAATSWFLQHDKYLVEVNNDHPLVNVVEIKDGLMETVQSIFKTNS